MGCRRAGETGGRLHDGGGHLRGHPAGAAAVAVRVVPPEAASASARTTPAVPASGAIGLVEEAAPTRVRGARGTIRERGQCLMVAHFRLLL